MSDRTPVIAANWKMNKTVPEASEFCDSSCRRSRTRRRGHDLPAVPRPAGGRRGDRGRRGEVAAQNMHYEHSGAFTGEVSAADAPRRRVDGGRARPLRAPAALRRDRRGAGPQGPGRAGGGPDADPLRRRDRGRARARRDRPDPAPPDRRRPLAGAARAARGRRGRLRAGLGDRHRADRHARAGRGRLRVRPLADLRPRRRPPAAACGSSTAAP